MLASDTRVRRRPDVLDSRVGDSVFALDIESGDCFSFSGPSARLWDLLAEPVDAGEAARILAREYEIEEQSCLAEVADHFRKLQQEGLIAPVQP